MEAWNAYWFRPAPYVDLAMVRIFAVACQLYLLFSLSRYSIENFELLLAMPDPLYDPIPAFRVFLLPFGLDYRPPLEFIKLVIYVTMFAGLLALIGVITRVSLWIFTIGNVFLITYMYSHGDAHHTEAPLMIALGILALSPCGHVLSVDYWLRQRRIPAATHDVLTAEGPLAGWPIRLIQWLFVLIYLSAILSKLVYAGGLEWLNGYTLQYYLIQDTLRKGTLLGGWFAQHHTLVMLSQYLVVTFQATFALAVMFPQLRWIYVPVGLGFHLANWVALHAPFFEWMALYAVFIPWRRAFEIGVRHLQPAPMGVPHPEHLRRPPKPS